MKNEKNSPPAGAGSSDDATQKLYGEMKKRVLRGDRAIDCCREGGAQTRWSQIASTFSKVVAVIDNNLSFLDSFGPGMGKPRIGQEDLDVDGSQDAFKALVDTVVRLIPNVGKVVKVTRPGVGFYEFIDVDVSQRRSSVSMQQLMVDWFQGYSTRQGRRAVQSCEDCVKKHLLAQRKEFTKTKAGRKIRVKR